MAFSAPPQTFHSHATFGEFLASDPELLIFRRFDLLNARALLYLQSEPMSLETQLLDFNDEDVKDGSMDVMQGAKCLKTLSSRAADDLPREAERVEVIRRTQEVKYRYSEFAFPVV